MTLIHNVQCEVIYYTVGQTAAKMQVLDVHKQQIYQSVNLHTATRALFQFRQQALAVLCC